MPTLLHTQNRVLKQGDSIRCIEMYQDGEWYVALQRITKTGIWENVVKENKTYEEILKLREVANG